MRRTLPVPVHAVPLGAGDHRAAADCACRPILFRDLAEPDRVVYVHRAAEGRAAVAMHEAGAAKVHAHAVAGRVQ